jgi:arabinan endo-1,5-alpha-L-arabinosidase
VIKVGDIFYVFGSHLAAAKTKDFMQWDKVADGVNSDNPLFENVVEELKRLSTGRSRVRCGQRTSSS